jgi:thiol-disulfide isomerase/thioredoxin
MWRNKMPPLLRQAGIAIAALVLLNQTSMAAPGPAPEFTHKQTADWLNSAPLSLAGLRGKPVLIEFWTFACGNCRNTLPWLQSVAARYRSQGLAMVSVHTPELPREFNAAAVREAVADLGITWPVMIDNDFSYWRALNNHYWPAFYLLDASGQISATSFGEFHRGEKLSDAFEKKIQDALAVK